MDIFWGHSSFRRNCTGITAKDSVPLGFFLCYFFVIVTVLYCTLNIFNIFQVYFKPVYVLNCYEPVSNSLKHAFLGKDKGEFRIKLIKEKTENVRTSEKKAKTKNQIKKSKTKKRI
jgi:hypothetical protein